METKRKIIQIATSSEGENTYAVLYCLCNDGTLWKRVTKKGADFEQVKIATVLCQEADNDPRRMA